MSMVAEAMQPDKEPRPARAVGSQPGAPMRSQRAAHYSLT